MKSRIRFIDIARANAMLFIVFGHTIVHNKDCYGLYKLLYSFHVVLFFIISGYTYNRDASNKEYIRKKFFGLMIPYFLFSLLFLIPYMLMGEEVNQTIGYGKDFEMVGFLKEIAYGVGVDGRLKQNTALWFLPALFSTETIFKIVDLKMLRRIDMHVKLFFFFAISFLFSKCNIVFPWGINTALVLIPFFYLGYIYRQREVILKLKKGNIYTIVIGVISLCLAFFLAEVNTTVSCANYKYGNYFMFVYTSIVFSTLILFVSSLIHESRWLEVIGGRTMGILIFHKLIILVFQTKVPGIKEILQGGNIYLCILTALIVSVIATVVCCFLDRMIKQYFPYAYGKKDKKEFGKNG